MLWYDILQVDAREDEELEKGELAYGMIICHDTGKTMGQVYPRTDQD
jgi:hypothetical protein